MKCLTLLAAATASLAAALPAQAQGISGDVVKIAVLSDMSGPYADTAGRGSVEATKLAVEDFGGTVAGKKIEVVFADHQGKADVGSSKARTWFDTDGVDVVVDLNNSAVAMAVYNLAKERNKLILTSGGASDALTSEACIPTAIHYTYDTYAMASGVAHALLAQGKKDWYIMAVDYAFGKAGAETVTNIVSKNGGKVTGRTNFPLNASDFSSFVLQAQESKAPVVTLVSAGNDTINAIKSANQFGLMKNQTVAPQFMFIQDVHSLGLKTAQGLTFATAFYWDRTPETRAFAQRFHERMGKKTMPSMVHAGTYSAVTQYLKAVAAINSDDGPAVTKYLKSARLEDFFSQNGRVREDGRMVHDLYLAQVKSPAESKGPWDYYRIIGTIPGDKAFRPLEDGKCPLVKKG
ncbi:ABC transporter substrate-binding protein [Comamonas humi]